MSRTERELLIDAREHFRKVTEYAQQDLSEPLVMDAICMRLSAGIEVLSRLDDDSLRARFADWEVMWGMRNRIAHGYLLVDDEVVRSTVAEDLPAILVVLESAIS